MTKEQMDQQLIEACILEKWLPIVENTYRDMGQLVTQSCCLCQVYNHIWGCDGCPVKLKSGDDHCEGTPYMKWSFISSETNAKKELEFLISLLPENHPWVKAGRVVK